MTAHWIFQANPDRYDIGSALGALDTIAWRTPQYAASIVAGDGVVIWRSGAEAGVIAVGRVLDRPAERVTPPAEERFATGDDDNAPTTRVTIAVRRSKFQPKATVAELPGWADHQIITGPMGTVFQVTDAQWKAIAPLLPSLPDAPSGSVGRIPPAFAWGQRRKDTSPLPGGYSGYLDSLRMICAEVDASQPSREALHEWMQDHLGVTETSARLSLGFLIRIGLLHERSGTMELGDVAAEWLSSRDHALVIGLLHSRVRLIGEFLAETDTPITDIDLLAIANAYYGAGWQSRAQIRRRRGWLQSGGFLEETEEGLLHTTDAGRELLGQLELYPRTETPDPVVAPVVATPDPKSTLPPPARGSGPEPEFTPIAALIDRLHITANDGSQAEAFERETTEAFARLGYRSTWLGKAGRTDVLLEADLGQEASYRVIVDCKSTGRGVVSQQIDWDTIDEHRRQHQADYAVIVAPGFGGGKLGDRASRHDTVLLTVDDLAELLIQHDRTPLSLETYRALFAGDDAENSLAGIGEVALESERRLALVSAVLDLLTEHGPRMAPMSARDFDLLLLTRDDLPDATEGEIEEVLTALSTPLLGLLDRNIDGAVRYLSRPATAAATLGVLAEHLAPGVERADEPA